MFSKLFYTIVILLVTNIHTSNSERVCNDFGDYWYANSKNCEEVDILSKNLTEIIQTWNFNTEEYTVTTNDGYILTIIRAYNGRPGNIPVILGHDIFSNSLAFVATLNNSLIYDLVSKNYDIWILNYRGTVYSRKHIKLDTNDIKYWNFSFYEVGYFDVRTSVDFIYKKTNKKSVFVGLGEGATVSYIYCIMWPTEAKQKLYGLSSLGPLAYNYKVPSALGWLSLIKDELRTLVNKLWHGEFVPRSVFNGDICGPFPFNRFLCETLMGLNYGYDFDQIDPKTVAISERILWDATSMDTAYHYIQMYTSGNFEGFDFGTVVNKRKYGQPTPLKFQLSRIPVPVAICVGQNDLLATVSNAKRTYNELTESSRCGFDLIENPQWAHLDFVQAKDAPEVVYSKVVFAIESFSKGQCIKSVYD